MSDSPRDDETKLTRRQIIARGGALAAALLAGTSACDGLAGCGENGADRTRDDQTRDQREQAGQARDTANGGQADAGAARPPEGVRPDAGDAPREYADWQEVRAEFEATPDLIHMACLLIASHPKPVREAIERHRKALDENPAGYLTENWGLPADRHDEEGEGKAMRAAGRYLDMDHRHIALVPNTTHGLTTVYNGINIREDQEVVSGHWNHWATEGNLDYRAQKIGFDVRRPSLYDDLSTVTADELTDRLIDEITDKTRIVATTWVHSISGLKLPIAQIGQRIDEINRGRDADDRVLFCVDGVHGFGVEDAAFDDLHCDFFVAGCHKWLFGPRGTGIIAGAPDAWQHAVPTTPSFSGSNTPGRRFTPGGFHAFEHRFALEQAFAFHQNIGKERVAERIHALTAHLIEGLGQMDHVDLRTPTDPELTAGIVTFQVDGHTTWEVVGHLEQEGIIASITPEDGPVPRLSPGLLNDHDEVEKVLGAVAGLS